MGQRWEDGRKSKLQLSYFSDFWPVPMQSKHSHPVIEILEISVNVKKFSVVERNGTELRSKIRNGTGLKCGTAKSRNMEGRGCNCVVKHSTWRREDE